MHALVGENARREAQTGQADGRDGLATGGVKTTQEMLCNNTQKDDADKREAASRANRTGLELRVANGGGSRRDGTVGAPVVFLLLMAAWCLAIVMPCWSCQEPSKGW